MKPSFSRLLTSASISFFCLAASAGPTPAPDVRDLFVPNGYTDHDDAVAVASGYLDGVCYQLGKPEVTTDLTQHRITVTVMAVRKQAFCHPIAVRFDQVVHLGRLPEGEFTVQTQGVADPQTLLIQRATGRENTHFAQVYQAAVNVREDKQAIASLQGSFTNSCQHLDHIDVSHHGNTVEVSPLLEADSRDAQGAPCRDEVRVWKQQVELPALDNGRYLLHVRSAEGTSVNHVFDYPNPFDDRNS